MNNLGNSDFSQRKALLGLEITKSMINSIPEKKNQFEMCSPWLPRRVLLMRPSSKALPLALSITCLDFYTIKLRNAQILMQIQIALDKIENILIEFRQEILKRLTIF